MKPASVRVPQDIPEILEIVVSMLSSAPKFLDKMGYLPFVNLDYTFRQLNEGLAHNRQTLGEPRYHLLMQMSDRMRAHFEADQDDTNGETLLGCKIIHAMEDILREARRKA